MRKTSVLFFALLLPILIFLFLRFFGKNEFEIPVYYEQSIADQPALCEQSYQFPYRIPSTSSLPITGVTVVLFGAGLQAQQLEESAFQMSRLKSQSFGDAITTVWVGRSGQAISDLKISPLILDSASYDQEKTCIYLMQSNDLILIDSARQIRGYYKEASLKEIDRLIMELKILLNNY